MFADGHRNFSELLRGGAVFMHMPLRHQRIERRHQRAVGHFELRMCAAALGHALHGLGTRTVREQVLSGDA